MFDSNYERSNFPQIRPDWLAQADEPVIEPALPLIDPHHHLWDVEGAIYRAPQLVADVNAGHRVVATLFVECKAHFDTNVPAALAPVGETRFAVAEAREAAALMKADRAVDGHGAPDGLVKGIIAYGDPYVQDPSAVLAAHREAGQGRMRGVRVRAAWHADPAFAAPADGPTAETIRSPELDNYCSVLADMGLVLDLWAYHTQLDDVAALARLHPGLPIVLNHCGGPLGIGPYAGQRNRVMQTWKASLARVADQRNVHIKIGGLAMPRTGMSFATEAAPGNSIALAERWTPYVETCIGLFGAERSMFESNFPVDKGSCNYVSLWNAFKRMTASYPAADRREMLAGTANRVYSLGVEF